MQRENYVPGELAGSDYFPRLNPNDYKYNMYCLLEVLLIALCIMNTLLMALGKKRAQLSSGMFLCLNHMESNCKFLSAATGDL